MRILILLLILQPLIYPIIQASENSWSTEGPNDARVMTIAIHPDDNNVLYLGTVENGLYKTTDAGQNWSWLDDEFLYPNMRHIEFHPADPDTMYAATMKGLFKSADAGESWEYMVLPLGLEFECRSFIIHPEQPNIMIVDGVLWHHYKSVDGGNSWTELDLPMVSAQKFVLDPVNTNIVYLATQSGRYGLSVLVSDDLGETWTNIHNDMDTSFIALDLTIDPIETQTLYICGWNIAETEACVAKTIDAGDHWTDITPPGLIKAEVHSVTVSPLDHQTIYLCSIGNGVLKSTNGGESWQEMNNGLKTSDAKRIVIDSTTGHIYLGTYWSGIYKSTDDGEHWQKISSGINNANCTDFSINYNDSDTLFVATKGGLYRSSDGTQSWKYIDCTFPHYDCYPKSVEVDPYDPRYVYVGLNNRWGPGSVAYGFRRSTDGGISWEICNNGIPEGMAAYSRIGVSDLGNSTRRLYMVSTWGLFISDDLGLNWNWHEYFSNTNMAALDVCRSASNNVYVSDYNGRLFKSTDFGENWNQVSIPNNGELVLDVFCDPSDSNTVYVSVNDIGLLKTTDAGNNWININNDLPQHPSHFSVYGIAVNPNNSESIYANSAELGVYYSNNGGVNWYESNEDLNTRYTKAYTIIDPTDTCRVFLATSKQSVWSITRTPTAIDDDIPLPMTFYVSNYPNPFNASTNIKFTLPNSSDVKIDIYDILGRRVSTIVNEHLFAGYHSVIWNPESLSSGLYFYRIRAGEIELSQKMMLLR